MPPAPLPLSKLATRTPEQPISHFMKLALENPGLVSLAAGFVDESAARLTRPGFSRASFMK